MISSKKLSCGRKRINEWLFAIALGNFADQTLAFTEKDCK